VRESFGEADRDASGRIDAAEVRDALSRRDLA